MVTLIEIKQNFLQDLQEWFDTTSAYIAMVNLGKKPVRDGFNDKNKSYPFCIPTSLSFDLSTLHELKYSDIYKKWIEHPTWIQELALSRLVQLWYDFLNQIIEQVIDEHLQGLATYNLNKFDIKINFKNISSYDDLIEKLPTLIRDDFDFIKGKDKLKKIAKILNTIILETQQEEVKKYIIVRNLIEHNHGKIRQKDLSDLGGHSIKLWDNSLEYREFTENEKVEISIYELYQAKRTFEDVAHSLIPGASQFCILAFLRGAEILGLSLAWLMFL